MYFACEQYLSQKSISLIDINVHILYDLWKCSVPIVLSIDLNFMDKFQGVSHVLSNNKFI